MARKEKKFHYIYKITNTKNNRYYIGMHSTDSLEDNYMGSGKRIKNSIRKHGLEVHKKEILEFLNDTESLKKREQEIVNEVLLQDPFCLNLCIGGKGGIRDWMLDSKLAKEYGQKGGTSLRNKMKDDKYREDYIEKTRRNRENGAKKLRELGKEGKLSPNAFKGKKHSEESILLMKEKKKGHGIGESNSQFGSLWIYHSEKKINKKIKKEEIEIYINNGWIKGMKPEYF